MSSTQVSTEQQRATGIPTAATVDLKLEVVVIPVSDVDRAKRFYERSGVAAGRRLRRRRQLASGPVHASRFAVLDPFRQGSHSGRAGLVQESLSRGVGHGSRTPRAQSPGAPR